MLPNFSFHDITFIQDKIIQYLHGFLIYARHSTFKCKLTSATAKHKTFKICTNNVFIS